MIGALLVIIGLLLGVWTLTVLGWRRLLGLADEPPNPALPRLVLAGPYQVVRHPFFLAILIALAGLALANGGSVWVALALAVVVLPIVAKAEERRLAERFGEAYCRYQRVVPFLLPLRRSVKRET